MSFEEAPSPLFRPVNTSSGEEQVTLGVQPATRARIETEARELSEDLHLAQLRKARGLTQAALADLLGVKQDVVSTMERRTELCLATLRKFIEAMEGELVLAARFARKAPG